jgi:hypothetical protein
MGLAWRGGSGAAGARARAALRALRGFLFTASVPHIKDTVAPFTPRSLT